MLGQIYHDLGEHVGMSYFMSIQFKFWTIFISSQFTANLNQINLLLYIEDSIFLQVCVHFTG